MQEKLLKEIVASIVGPSSSKMVDLLYNKRNVNEFLISKKMNLTINQTRNILYKLSDGGLVSFIRKKDNKKGGWYTYFWTLNSGKSLSKFKENLLKSISSLNERIAHIGSGRFYYCVNCSKEYDEENALLNDYTCSECGEILQLKDNTSEIEILKKEVLKLENVLNQVNSELNLIFDKEQKTRERKMRLELKRKSAERLARKKERDKLKNKSLKKKKSKKENFKKGKLKKKINRKLKKRI